MWHLYVFMSLLTAGVVLKLVAPLLGRGREGQAAAVTRQDRTLIGLLVMIVPVAAISLYLVSGRPDLRGSPAIFDDVEALSRRHLSLLAQRPMTILLERDPDDIGALVTLGQIHTELGNHAEAVKFLSHAVRSAVAQQDDYLRLYAVSLGEAQIRANGGRVGDDAVETFHFVRKMYPESPLARHYLALRKAQTGDTAGAVEDWLALLNEGPTRAYWKVMVRKSLAAVRAQQHE